MKPWGLALAALSVALALWACVLLAELMQPIRAIPQGHLVLPVTRWDTTAGGHCQLFYIPVRLDR